MASVPRSRYKLTVSFVCQWHGDVTAAGVRSGLRQGDARGCDCNARCRKALARRVLTFFRREEIAVDMNISPSHLTVYSRDPRHLRIAVVSEVRFLREGVGEILERDPSVAVVALCTDLAEAALSPDLRPDVVLLDAALPDGPAAVSRLHHHRLGAGGRHRLRPEHCRLGRSRAPCHRYP